MSNKNIYNKIFLSYDQNNEIEIDIIDGIAWFNINKFDPPSYKTFLFVLKEVMEYLNDNKVIYIKQYIKKDVLEYFTNSTYIDVIDDTIVITTSIENFVNEISNVLGFTPMKI